MVKRCVDSFEVSYDCAINESRQKNLNNVCPEGNKIPGERRFKI
jgi:hypothetical protein